MNQKAADLGIKSTHFENATGLHNANHYTTVKDLAILLSYALQNDIFREIFTSSHHSTPPTNKHPGWITFYSTMFEELNNQNIIDGEISEEKLDIPMKPVYVSRVSPKWVNKNIF